MKSVLTSLCLLGVVAGLILAAGEKRDKPPDKNPCVNDRATDDQGNELTPLEETTQADLKFLLAAKPPKPVNGVTLRVTAKQVIKKRSNQIVVDWTINYDGPRPPLVILTPCLSDCHRSGNTRLAVYAVGQDGKAYCVTFRSPVAFEQILPIGPPKECYLTVPAGRATGGSLRVSTEQIRRRLLESHLDQFDLDRRVIPKMYLKLYHAPTERGEDYDLDAWTGMLASNLVPLKLSQW